MLTTGYRVGAAALALVLASALGVQRVANAGDAGAVIGGIVAGALVYELLDDDDDDRYYRGRTRYYSPRYRTGYYESPRYHRRDCRPSYELRVYYDDRDCRRARPYVHDWYSYDSGPRVYRAPSHGRRHGPPPGHVKKAIRSHHGRSYRPPGRYCR